MDSLRASPWRIARSAIFESAALLAVNLGDRYDTTAAITGQIAGAICGYSAIPTSFEGGLMGGGDAFTSHHSSWWMLHS